MYSYDEVKKLLGIETAEIDFQTEFSKTFFYANVCQFCSGFHKDINVRRCGSCTAMFYCKQEHHKAHWPSHKEFCVALQAILAESKKDYIFQDMLHDPRDEVKDKNYILDLIQKCMNRKLHDYELNMFMFPRVCIACSEPNPTSLKPCSKCPHANFCQKHLDYKEHEKICSMFTFCYHLDHYSTVFKQIPLERFIGAIPRNIKMLQLTKTMDIFLNTYVGPYHPRIDLAVPAIRMLVSKNVTRSLTVIYAIEKLQFKIGTTLRIHVISKSKYQEINFIEWELLFHWFYKLKSIQIVFIGSEVYPVKSGIQVCTLCHATKKILRIEVSSLIYKHYLLENNKKPDLIVGFDIDSMSQITCTGAWETFTNFNVPIILTANNELDLANGIKYSVGNSCNFSAIEKNPFASLRPERSYRRVGFSNHYISIYGNVFPKITELDLENLFKNYCKLMNKENNKSEDTTQEQSHGEMIDDEKKEEGLAEGKEEEKLIDEENLTEEEYLTEDEYLTEEENITEEEKLIEEEKKEKISESKKPYDIYKRKTQEEIINDILINAEMRNKTLKQKVKLYRDKIAKLNEYNNKTTALHNELKDFSQEYYDLEARIHEVRFFSMI